MSERRAIALAGKHIFVSVCVICPQKLRPFRPFGPRQESEKYFLLLMKIAAHTLMTIRTSCFIRRCTSLRTSPRLSVVSHWIFGSPNFTEADKLQKFFSRDENLFLGICKCLRSKKSYVLKLVDAANATFTANFGFMGENARFLVVLHWYFEPQRGGQS